MADLIKHSTQSSVDISLDTGLPPVKPQTTQTIDIERPIQAASTSSDLDLSALSTETGIKVAPDFAKIELDSLSTHRHSYLQEAKLTYSSRPGQNLIFRIITWLAALLKSFELRALAGMQKLGKRRQQTVVKKADADLNLDEISLKLKKRKKLQEELEAAQTIKFSSEN